VTLIPASSFLAGSLLSLLIPVFLLIALVVWYVKCLSRVPEPTDGNEAAAAGTAQNPGTANTPASRPNPASAGAPGGAAPPDRGRTPPA
jgi:hypothetical protein